MSDVQAMLEAAVVSFSILALGYTLSGAYAAIYEDGGLAKFVVCVLIALFFVGVLFGVIVK